MREKGVAGTSVPAVGGLSVGGAVGTTGLRVGSGVLGINETDGDMEGSNEGELETISLGECDGTAVGLELITILGAWDGDTDGESDGAMGVEVGGRGALALLGDAVSVALDGAWVSPANCDGGSVIVCDDGTGVVGTNSRVGRAVGCIVGSTVGSCIGDSTGATDGSLVSFFLSYLP